MRRPLLLATFAAGLLAAPALIAAQTLLEAPPPVGPAIDVPLFTAQLWNTLPPIDAPMAAWLGARLPGVRTDKVRELGFDAADQVIGQAVARGYAGSDLFTDPGLRSERMFYLRQADAAKVFERYELRVLTLTAGVTKDGDHYELQGLLLGGGRVALLYSLSEFEFHNPYFPSHEFRIHDPVTYTIRGDGDLGVEGAWVKWHLLWPKIDRFVKISPQEVRVETGLGSSTDPLTPIRRR